jgi:nucleoside-diphosphate-sugar epimerase
MRILVSGHRGYVGSVLVPMLRSAGHDVIGLDIDLYRECDFGSAPMDVPCYMTDVRDVSHAQLTDIDVVLHLAGLSNDPLGDLDPILTEEFNLHGTLKLARAAKAAGVGRFVFASSCSNYGAADGDDWLTETSPMNPVTPYAVSKLRCEEELDKLADRDFSPVYLRSATAYGMSPRIRFDLVVNNLIAWATATGDIRLKSDGSAWRPLVHVEDMALAFLLAATADRDLVHREAFNVGRNEDCMRIRDLSEMIHQGIPGTRITFAADRITDSRTYRVDCSKIRRIGFDARWTLERGIEQLRDAFRLHGVRVADFEGARYQRLAHIRQLMETGELDPSLRRTQATAA